MSLEVNSGHAWVGFVMKLHGIGDVAIYAAPAVNPNTEVLYSGIDASGMWTWSIFMV